MRGFSIGLFYWSFSIFHFSFLIFHFSDAPRFEVSDMLQR